MKAEDITRALGGRWQGHYGTALCPAHDDQNPSLSIRDGREGRLLVYCHAGCSQAAVIAALQAKGLWRLGQPPADRQMRRKPTPRRCELAAEDKKRLSRALQIWCEARPAAGTLVAAYLGRRGITLAPPRTLRVHPALRHASGARMPAMVALVTAGLDDRPIGIHRTFLSPDGLGKALVSPAKMMMGRCRGGAVRLAPASTPLMIGEGIETALSAIQVSGHGAWAALSTSGLRTLELPRAVRDVIVLADGDAPGEAAAEAAAARWSREGRRVRIARPPAGRDFNDFLVLPRDDEDGV